MAKNGEKMFTVTESASYLGKSTKTVRRYIKQGLLPCKRMNGKFGPEIRISREGLDRLPELVSKPSRPEEEALEIIGLYRKASPENRELVRKILTSVPEEEDLESRGGFLRPFFRKSGGEKA
jgi:excisionase family DNA binding protein